MAVSGWGGVTAFINEGLRRAEEDRKRKEEEEKRRLAEERRRQSLIPNSFADIMAKPTSRTMGPPTREEASRSTRPTISLAQSSPGPMMGIENPYKVDASTPQISASQPTQQSVVSAPQPQVETPQPQIALQNPRRQQQVALGALNTPAPTLNVQSQVPPILPQLGQAVLPVVQQGLQNFGNIIPAIGQGFQEAGEAIGEWATSSPLGRYTLSTMALNTPELWDPLKPSPLQQSMQSEQAKAASEIPLIAPLYDDREPTTAAGAVVERFRHNMFEEPKDAADQLLQKYAPAVFGLLKGTEAIGVLDELTLGATKLGEWWSKGAFAQRIFNQQRQADLANRQVPNLFTGETLDPEQEKENQKLFGIFEQPQGFGGVPQGYQAPQVSDLWAAIQLADEQFAAALAPTALQLKTANPTEIARATAAALSTQHHGIASMAQMFDDMLDLGPKVTELRDQAQAKYQAAQQLPPGPEREQLLFEAATLGAQAKQLAHTHPAQLFDKNANWWMAAPAEAIFGITNLADFGMDVLKLTPKARRLAKGEKLAGMTVEQATKAMQAGPQQNPLEALRNWWQLNSSQAMVDARNNFRTLTSILQGFNTKEDVRKIIGAYTNDPLALLQNGLPASEFTSPVIKSMFPAVDAAAPTQDVVRFGPADFGNQAAIQSHAALKPIAELLSAMPSLQGEGAIDITQFFPELYTLLTRGAAEMHKVATLAGVPAGAVSANTRLLGDGSAVVQYIDAGKKVLSESAAMGIGEANKRVREARQFLKSGQEFVTNYVQGLGNLQRTALGLTTVNANLRNLINDGISNRLLATADGVFSWNGFDHNLSYIQGITGGIIPYDEVARVVATEMATSGNIASQFTEGIFKAAEKIPIVGQIPAMVQRLRQMDERNLKVMVYAKTHKDFMEGAGARRFVPFVEQLLKDAGWTDTTEIKNAAASVWDAGMKGGWSAAAYTYYQIANGSNPVSAASISSIYRDVYGAFADQLDSLVRSVTPDNVQQMATQLDSLRSSAASALTDLTADYVDAPGRHYYTRLEDQKNLVEVQTALKNAANILQEDYATGVQPYLENIANIQKTINDNVLQVLQMAKASPDAAGHVWELWGTISELRHRAQKYLDDLAKDLLNTRGMTSDEIRIAYDRWRLEQDGAYNLLNYDGGLAIDETRQLIASGAPYTGDAPFLGILQDLAYDPLTVFEINKRKPGSMKYDPNAQAAKEAGRAGTRAFIAQMFMLLQQFPTQTGMDHYVSAVDDVGRYWNKHVGPLDDKVNEIAQRARGMQQEGAEWRRVNKEYEKAYKERNDAYVKYYEYAYLRYQATSALIAQAGMNGVANLPTFTPTGMWGVPSWGENPVVTLLGINIRNPKEFLIRTPTGSEMKIPRMHVPEATIKEWENLVSNLYGQLAQQVNKVGVQLFQGGTGSEVIDALIANIRTSTKNPVFDAVRQDMASYMANPQGYGDLGSQVGNFLQGQIDQIAKAIQKKLPEIAQRNVRKVTPITMDQVRRFASEAKPLWDNLMAGANQAAEEMVSFSLTDFIRQYKSDALAGLFIPYSYWATRQGKNMLERMLFEPRMFGLVAEGSKIIQSEARRQELPQRYNNAINTGVMLPNDEVLMINSPIPRWAPFALRYIFGGWADMDRANQGAEVLLNDLEANGFPGWNSTKGIALLGPEIMQASGLALYPHWKDLSLWFAGRGGEISLANYGFWGQIAGNIAGAATGQYQQGIMPFYQPYTVARDVANQFFGVSNEADPILAAGQAQFEGRDVAPEFAAAHPQAGEDWIQAFKEESLERLIFQLLGGITSLNMSSMDPKEPQRLEAQKLYSDMAYGPENPTGSRERTQMLDESSPNFMPGLSAGMATYQVIGEGPQREAITPAPPNYPYTPTYETRKLDEGVVLGEYLDQRDEIYDRYKQEEVAQIKANPQWMGEKVDSQRSAWYRDFYDRRQAELEALEAAYPTVAGKYKEITSASLRGANPLETTEAALDRLIRQATEENEALNPGDYPEGGSNEQIYAWNQQNDRYQQAISARLQELMNDPEAASQAVFGRPLDTQGPVLGQPTPRVGPANAADAGTGQATLGQQPESQRTATVDTQTAMPAGVTQDPNNPWAAEMAAAEEQYGLPTGLLQEVARNESNFRPDAESGAGAMGLMQIMPGTWEEWAPKVGVSDPWKPEDSIAVSAAYLNWLAKQLPADQRDTYHIMVAYNWGIGNVLEKGADKAPSETKAYSNTIASAVDQPVSMASSGVDTTLSTGTQQQFIRPIQGGSELVTQGYGANVEAYKTWNDEHGHEGIDYGVPVGTPVLASAGGTVEFVGTGNGFGNYGNYVVIDHGNGYKSYYAHLSAFDVEKGDVVEQGQVIAKSGNTGRSSGPHLHFSLRLEGDTSGPYGMVDPTDYILGRKGVTPRAGETSSFVTETDSNNNTGKSSVSLTHEPTAPSSSGINWGVGSAEEALARDENKYKSPEKVALDDSIDAAWAHSLGRIQAEYPDHANLFDLYRGVNDEDRPDWKNANPMIRALNLLVYNEEEWEQVEQMFGEGMVEKWALIPRGPNVSEQAGDYYRQYPDVFVAKAWIQGRPRPYDTDAEFNPEQAAGYNFGIDYEKAKELFGDNIWEVVRTYYASVPRYVEGGDNSAWIAFKEQYPQFDAWREWWYALMNDGQQTARQGFGFGRGFSGGFDGFDPSQGEHPQYVKGVEALRGSAPKWQNPPASSGDWRRYLELSRLGVRNPRQ